ncbi:MAG: hypothetical protein QW417_02050 [Zestosphaera sp.]
MLTHIGPDIVFCRSLCEVYSIGSDLLPALKDEAFGIVDQDGILVVKNFFLHRKTHIPRNEILHVYVQTPNPLGMWFRQGRSKAIIVHEKGKTVFALYSGT